MPYMLRKMPKQSCYRVYNKRTKKVFSKFSSLENAKKQMRLLNAIEYGDFVPTGQPSRNGRKTRRKRQVSRK
jgi:hypothetical protein